MNKLITNQTPYYTLQLESMLDFPNEELVEELNLEQTDLMQRQLITKVAVKASLMHKSQLTETITDEVIETHKIIGIEPHLKYLIVDIENTTNDKVFSVKVDIPVYYDRPPFFCKLILNNGTTVELEGSGELTRAMVSGQYKGTLVSAEIGELCTSIGYQAFYQCTSLTSVTIGNGVTSIGEGAFTSCTSLTSVTIGNGVTSIGLAAFTSCTSLTSVTIGNGVTSIGQGAFADCRSLTSVVIPNSVISIGLAAFTSCTSLTSVIIGNSVTSIGEQAFASCSSLYKITSHIMVAPNVQSATFGGVSNGGTLYVPIGSSGYDVWMQNANYYLGLYNWTKVEQ